jgi:hypothetical protein
MDNAKLGDITEWVDLCKHALQTDSNLFDCIDTRKNRVPLDRLIVVPGEAYDSNLNRLASKAAEFCSTVLDGIRPRNLKFRRALDAIGQGFSATELIWGREHGANVIKDLQWVNARRFRWDREWQLRLYDYGEHFVAGDYGQPLERDCWLVLVCNYSGGYPGEAGIIRNCIWPWNFKMWVNRYHIHATERYGQSFIAAKVSPGTKQSVIDETLDKLERLSYDSVGVFEEGTEIVFAGGPSTVNNGEMFDRFLDRADRAQTKAVLGATDVSDPGTHGSQAAVETRVEEKLEPRTEMDTENFCDAVTRQMFEPLIRYNLHLFDGVLPPYPKYLDKAKIVLKRAYEVQTEPGVDQSGEITSQPDRDADAVDTTADKTIQEVSLNGAQISSLLDILDKIVIGNLPRESGVYLISVAFNLEPAKAERIVGEIGRGFMPSNPEIPKNTAPSKPPTNEPVLPSAVTISEKYDIPRTDQGLKKKLMNSINGSSRTRQISLSLISPLKIALSKGLDD